MAQDVISVLLIEDEAEWTGVIRDSLESFGFEVVAVADNFDDAVSAINSKTFDIALVDIYMNGRNRGIEIGKMLSGPYHKPFIFMTASPSRDTATEALDARPSSYLLKPFNPLLLFAAIQNALQNFNNKVTDSPASPVVNTESFFVKVGDRYKKILWDEVVYLSSEKNYTSLFCSADNSTYYIRSTLSKTIQHLIPQAKRNNFAQVSRAEAVNIHFIRELSGNQVVTPFKSLMLTEAYSRSLKDRIHIIL
jgi:DNA-binding response OmpR family regulator